MKIVVDENMPYAQELFCRTGKVVAVPGRTLSVGMLKGADSLMVRSVTPVNQVLVENSGLRFVGTATAGTDHVDTAALEAADIGFSYAAGCNAIAVVEYVLSALLALAERDGFLLNQRTIGIVGAGHVGSRLQQRCEALGMRTLICDPPRADRGDAGRFHSLETLVQQADILTFHTPLNKEGRYKTWHIADEALLQSLLPGTILINASRGAVVDNPALLRTLQRRQDLRLVMDVWESEPDPDVALLQRADIGTAHIAGYTLEGKARGTTQIFAAWTAFLGDPQQVALDSLLPAPDISTVFLRGECDQAMLKRLAHLVYDVRRDDALLRQNIQQTGGFERLRKQYKLRREWSSLTIECDTTEAAGRLTQLGFTTRLR